MNILGGNLIQDTQKMRAGDFGSKTTYNRTALKSNSNNPNTMKRTAFWLNVRKVLKLKTRMVKTRSQTGLE